MKYVMFTNEEGHMLPVIFPTSMIHSDMAQYVQHMMMMEENKKVRPVSAGFVSMKGQTSGRSESLDLDSKPDDAMYITFNDSISTLSPEMMTSGIREVLEDKLNE